MPRVNEALTWMKADLKNAADRVREQVNGLGKEFWRTIAVLCCGALKSGFSSACRTQTRARGVWRSGALSAECRSASVVLASPAVGYPAPECITPSVAPRVRNSYFSILTAALSSSLRTTDPQISSFIRQVLSSIAGQSIATRTVSPSWSACWVVKRTSRLLICRVLPTPIAERSPLLKHR